MAKIGKAILKEEKSNFFFHSTCVKISNPTLSIGNPILKSAILYQKSASLY
jgi:hypothetical protein